MAFRDRSEAGQFLAEKLSHYAHRDDVLVLGIPCGGVPVAFEVAKALGAPLDAFLVRKLGLPGREELAMGAIASGGVMVLNDSVIKRFDVSDSVIQSLVLRKRRELDARARKYRGNRPPPRIGGRVVIVIDDGLATGASMRAAVEALRTQRPQRIVVAVPVGAVSTCQELQNDADEVVCFITPEDFAAVGMWYEDFAQTTDDDVKRLLEEAER